MIHSTFFNKSLILLSFFLLQYSFPQETSLEIQEKINDQSQKLKKLKKEIQSVEDEIIRKTKQAISNTEILIDLENKISLTEKLIRSINKEEKYIASIILNTENEIFQMETKLNTLKNQITQRLKYLYINGRPSLLETILLSNNWNETIYRVKYLEVLANYEKKLKKSYKETFNQLIDKRVKLEIELKYKKSLRSEKEIENSNLNTDKRNKKNILNQINKEKNTLEKELTSKEDTIKEMEALIKKLYSNKSEMKKREEELARIRAQQNRTTSGNFAIMKGKLLWPVEGKIISKFGTHRNAEIGTITENVGIDIQCKANSSVKAVLDGVVSTKTYIRGHGNIIIIDHGGGYSTVYAKVANMLVNENEYIQQGREIAITSNNTNSILHFEVWGNQNKLNPQDWLKSK